MDIDKLKKITPHKPVNNVLYALTRGIVEILGERVLGIYLFGSLSYEDFVPNRSDIDLLVITKGFLSKKELEEIKKFHIKIEEVFTEWGKRIECSYTPLEMFKNRLPINLHRPYFGAGIFYPAATYGNEWLINNYLVYKHGIMLAGPDIKTLIAPVDIQDVQKASIQDLYKEWVPKIIDETWLQNSHYQSYLILNLCRILHIVLNGEASSKSVSAEWVKKEFPQWKNLIQNAREWDYGKEMKSKKETIEFIKFTVSKVESTPMNKKEMTADEVLEILAIFREVGAMMWIAGGWGVDALVGKQTRQHNDIDVAFDTKQEEKIIDKFRSLGFFVEDDARPTRFVLRHIDGREIDMHPVVFGETGLGKQLVPNGKPFLYPKNAFTTGKINNETVPCLTAEQLVTFHLGYEPLEKDRHNMKMLNQYLNIPLPEVYR